MKISHLFEGRKERPDINYEPDNEIDSDDLDYTDDAEDQLQTDEVENIVMQMRKALDYNGDMLIKFREGPPRKLTIDEIGQFVIKHMKMKPSAKQDLQNAAEQSYESFKNAIK